MQAFSVFGVFGIAFAQRLLRLGALVGLVFALVGGTRFGRHYRVFAQPWAPGQLRSEARAALIVVAFDAAALTVLWWAAGQPATPRELAGGGLAANVLTFVALFIWYEIWFYASHRLLHTRRFYRWHRQHHTAVVCSPLTALSFSLGERLLLLLGIALFLAVGSLFGTPGLAGVLAYLALNQVLNVVGHSNVEPTPRGRVGAALARWLVTPTFHALHHARRRAHFGLFTTVLDRLFGTVEADHARRLAETAAGRPIQRLSGGASRRTISSLTRATD